MSEPLQKLRILTRTEVALAKIHLRTIARQTMLYAAGLLLVLVFTGFGLWAEHRERPTPDLATQAPPAEPLPSALLQDWWACITGGPPRA